MKKIVFLFLLLSLSPITWGKEKPIKPGAEQIQMYLPLLEGKRVGLFCNRSSLVGKTPLIDVLIKHHIQVTTIFSPEHGFRGDENWRVKNSIDTKTGIPIISLYGKKLSPTPDDLKNIDILVFDIQDVGVRFYTYISSLQKFMEAAVRNNKPLIILDRPNPNGFYVDGPVLDLKYKSFTGMQPVPIVYGMTIGEYANMLVGQEWLSVTPPSSAKHLKLTVIPCVNYTHKSLYVPPVKPSPNLPDIQSIYLYPSIGLFEATPISVGRGTDKPFQQFGHPRFTTNYTFKPMFNGISQPIPYENKICHGWNLSGTQTAVLKEINAKLQLKYLIIAYQHFPDKNHFFMGFNSMAGNDQLMEQIQAGMSERKIRNSWEPQLTAFKKIRKKYLLYPDFS